MSSETSKGAVPHVIEGGLGADDRGEVGFVNDFHFDGVKRFYTVANHRAGFVRAWHAHRRESKYVTVVQGAAVVAAVAVDNWESPSRDAAVHRYVLSAHKPSVVCIPAGYANGFMSLTDDARLVYFSTSTVEESRGDDVRFDAHYWDPWQIVER
jgi:dTDP-4-dehydrorhamnose 3,5-epimerase-like enzyme